jgi:uncharacterized protein YigE (DUF2233 family)
MEGRYNVVFTLSLLASNFKDESCLFRMKLETSWSILYACSLIGLKK